MPTRRRVLLGIGAFTLAGIAGCEQPESHHASFKPVPIEDGEECAVCGMIIKNFPGPKGEAYVRGAELPLKFCSTRDLFAYTTQPEAESVLEAVFVHDMASTPWEDPTTDAFVNGHDAWYVADQPLKGAMGPTLASFKERKDAIDFAERHGGRILTAADITASVISQLD